MNGNDVTQRFDVLQIDWAAVLSTDATMHRRHRYPAITHAIIVSASPAKSNAFGSNVETFLTDVNLWLSSKPAILRSTFAVNHISLFEAILSNNSNSTNVF